MNLPCFPNQATPPGSRNYYSVRFAATDLRADLALIFAWQHALDEIPRRCSDPGVAEAKLQWYREELSKALEGGTQHPLLEALVSLVQRHSLPIQPFLDMGAALKADIHGIDCQDLNALHAYCRLGGGARLELLTRICGDDGQRLASARELGAFVRIVDIIHNLGPDLRRGILFLPRDMLEEYGITAEGIADARNQDTLPILLSELATQARDWHVSALSGLPAGKQPAITPALSQAAIAHALLAELENAGFPVLSHRLSLTPLRKLWIAWRTSRRGSLAYPFTQKHRSNL